MVYKTDSLGDTWFKKNTGACFDLRAGDDLRRNTWVWFSRWLQSPLGPQTRGQKGCLHLRGWGIRRTQGLWGEGTNQGGGDAGREAKEIDFIGRKQRS